MVDTARYAMSLHSDPEHLADNNADEEELLRRGLDWLGRVVAYDLATVFTLRGSQLVAKVARGRLAEDKVKRHTLTLDDFPTIREAIEARRARAFTEADHAHGDGDPFDAVLRLPPGHACMVVPLCSGDSCYGVLTLDREVCETYPQLVVNQVEVFGQMLAAALQGSARARGLQRMHLQDHERARLQDLELAGDAVEVFENARSPAMRELGKRARQVAGADTPLMIVGEAGTAKARLARAIHHWSDRRSGPFIALSCAGTSVEVLEAELFGAPNQSSRLALATGGTVLLEEATALPITLQSKLLRMVEDKIARLNIRIILSTRSQLTNSQPGEHGPFNELETLLGPLNAQALTLPPLRECLVDLPLFTQSILTDLSRGGHPNRELKVSREGIARLAAYDWPGNVRELASVLERAALLTRSKVLGAEQFALPIQVKLLASRPPANKLLRMAPEAFRPAEPVATLDEVQAEQIRRVLMQTRGRIYGEGGAAALLGVKPSTLQSRMKKFGVTRQSV